MNPAETEKPILEFVDLWKKFGKNGKVNQVLSGVNLKIYPGELLAVLGASGSGKSVLMRSAGLLFDSPDEYPDSGEIYLFGINLLQLNEFELMKLRKRGAYVFQGNASYRGSSLCENIKFWFDEHRKDLSEQEKEEIVRQAIEAVRLDYKRDKDKMPSELSGGMAKRAAIAREIAHNPEIIIYDEPVSGLDYGTAEKINELIVKMHKTGEGKRTSIIVTHDLNSVESLEAKIAFLSNGKIKRYNSLKEVVNLKIENPEIRDYFGSYGQAR